MKNELKFTLEELKDKISIGLGAVGEYKYETLTSIIEELTKDKGKYLRCAVDYLGNFTQGKEYWCVKNGKKHYTVDDNYGDSYSVHKKCFS